MKTNVYDLDGKIIKELILPDYFEETYRPDLIKRAVIASQSRAYQAKGVTPYSNRLNTAEYRGVRKPNKMNVSINTGHARLPRLKNRSSLMAGRVAGISQAVGGPRAHPPKVGKILIKKINSKEKTKAILSAISATANLGLVSLRNNSLPENLKFPIIIENKFEDVLKTKDVFSLLEKIGLAENILRAKESKTIRAGKGKGRGRKYKRRKSVLVVLGDNKNHKAIGNLEGVDVVSARQLSIKELAPGTHAGRITIFTENAIEKLNNRFSKVI